MLARTLAALLLVAACSGPQKVEPAGGTSGSAAGPGTGTSAPTDPGTGGTGGTDTGGTGTSGPATPGQPTSSGAGPKLGEPCGPGDACGEGSCVSYRGIAGARGPEFKSCEIRCDAKGQCAGGRKCATIADGPGQVCR
jgi:hypothetical protein